jgi:hypothetical protein
VREAITDVYLQPEKLRLSDLLKEIQRQCQRKGLRVPNFRTVKRRVDAIDAKNTFESGPARKPLMIVSGPLVFYRPLICFPWNEYKSITL